MKSVIKNVSVEAIRFIKRHRNPIYRKMKGMSYPICVYRFGELNADKIIYFVTDISGEKSGIYAMWLSIISEISFAHLLGWTPVIDDTASLLFSSKIKCRKDKNIMNEIFDFNNAISVEEALNSRYVIINASTLDKRALLAFVGKEKEDYKYWGNGKERNVFEYSELELAYWREFVKKNMIYRKEVLDELEKAYNEVVGEYKQTDLLGIAIREGKMYLSLRQREKCGEHTQPTIKRVLEVAHKYVEMWNASVIYLSCESNEVIELFKEEFPQKTLLYLKRKRRNLEDCQKKMITHKRQLKSVNRIEDGSQDMVYLKDMYILSKCEYALLANNCGAEAMYLKGAGIKKFALLE